MESWKRKGNFPFVLSTPAANDASSFKRSYDQISTLAPLNLKMRKGTKVDQIPTYSEMNSIFLEDIDIASDSESDNGPHLKYNDHHIRQKEKSNTMEASIPVPSTASCTRTASSSRSPSSPAALSSPRDLAALMPVAATPSSKCFSLPLEHCTKSNATAACEMIQEGSAFRPFRHSQATR